MEQMNQLFGAIGVSMQPGTWFVTCDVRRCRFHDAQPLMFNCLYSKSEPQPACFFSAQI